MSEFNKFSDGIHGAALAIRITPRASQNEIVSVLNDRTIKIRLKTSPSEDDMNSSLINFLATVIGVPPANFNIVAGENGRDKLVSIDQVDMDFVHQKILENLA